MICEWLHGWERRRGVLKGGRNNENSLSRGKRGQQKCRRCWDFDVNIHVWKQGLTESVCDESRRTEDVLSVEDVKNANYKRDQENETRALRTQALRRNEDAIGAEIHSKGNDVPQLLRSTESVRSTYSRAERSGERAFGSWLFLSVVELNQVCN
jgi:hypothetical protein